MIQQALTDGTWLPYTFAFLMGLSMLIYAVLDGYDLGVGMLIDRATDDEKDTMIASIGPFWDANETWLILGVGLLLVAFPMAHGVILTALYLPVAIMLFGLIFRGVSFDFRAKVPKHKKNRWNKKFFYGSLLTALAQGFMLGFYIIGFDTSLAGLLFSVLIAVALASAYCLIGACWLIMKCEKQLQVKAVRWATIHTIGCAVGLAAVSVTTPLMSERIFNKWFAFPELLWLAPIPVLTIGLLLSLFLLLKKLPMQNDRYCWLPFVMTIVIFILGFLGLAYSFFPYLVPEKMTILQAAAAPASLKIMLVGALIVLPILIAYTFLAYRIFHGKATELHYD
ncbi:cytochrome d ubiquinol oxidase subunit II [Ostreibacterium oceani]|uniref:Cytochrome BD ubiquinol oxidase subunit II n=1 Tax=Ostreibacterium oceani TaxID=2654998 RepID=A0A6N7EW89_9GAMM|nr:cytochrome d ubiquinol oxidase subunit II [Ostreibacterium oceani]MPV85689.1 cytochrome BD ubiquinol oxidase subunit II [Ostreibacterium oceani]